MEGRKIIASAIVSGEFCIQLVIPKIREAMEQAFRESLDNTVPEAEVKEKGGWIIRLPNGDLDVVRWPEGEGGSITPCYGFIGNKGGRNSRFCDG